jgi:hypothetical protein
MGTRTAIGGDECPPEDRERRVWCSSSSWGAALLSFLRTEVAEDPGRLLYTRNGVLGGGVVVGWCRSRCVDSLIAAATASAEDSRDRPEGLPDFCVLGKGYSFRKGDDGDDDTTGGFSKFDGS